uniref:Metalloendopeptidase n=1 Tax=Takifugu rubripes TaxID=31033 RepID=A0A674N1P3_TAKRU
LLPSSLLSLLSSPLLSSPPSPLLLSSPLSSPLLSSPLLLLSSPPPPSPLSSSPLSSPLLSSPLLSPPLLPPSPLLLPPSSPLLSSPLLSSPPPLLPPSPPPLLSPLPPLLPLLSWSNIDPLVIFGDVAVHQVWRTLIPYCKYQQSVSQVRTLRSFSESTCIRFTPHDRQRDFPHVSSVSLGGYSFIGRRGRSQTVSLSRRGCVFPQIVQHEMLHALGFNHEQTRSDRDQHVRILLNNVIRGQEHNFRRINTNNLGTPYDYNSVMHYGRFAFSRNNQPTIVPIPNPNVSIGRATQMSPNDILRINRLYGCSE